MSQLSQSNVGQGMGPGYPGVECRREETRLSRRAIAGRISCLTGALYEDIHLECSEHALWCMELVWWGLYHVARRQMEQAVVAEAAFSQACIQGCARRIANAGVVLDSVEHESQLACDRRDCCSYIIEAASCELHQSGEVINQPQPLYHKLQPGQGTDEPVGILRGRWVNECWKQGVMRIPEERWNGVTMRGGAYEAWEVVRVGYRADRYMGEDPMEQET